MVEIEGNLLTPDHCVAIGNGEWSTARALVHHDAELPKTLAHIVYNIKLQEGGQIELGNKVFAGTLGARFDMTDPRKDPGYHEEDTRHLYDIPGYTSGHIHWAFGTASVHPHGMPSLYKRPSAPSKIGTVMLLDKDMQLRPDHIQKENAAPSPATSSSSSLGQPTAAQTCISGCTLLASLSGGILMREVRLGTPLLNAKGKKVLVTNVYFSRESAVMVQISEHCHTTITHPLVDTQKQKQGVRGRRKPTKTIVAAAE